MKGIEAASAADAEAFWDLMQCNEPEMIVLDLQLGQTDGVEQLRLLAKHRYAGQIVLISGHGLRLLATVRTMAEDLGLTITAALEKPLQIPALEHLLEHLDGAPRVVSAEQLRTAILNDEMALDFQPIVGMKPRTLKKLEALIRWDRGGAGMIQPSGFLPVAEGDTATMDALLDWVIGATMEAHSVLGQLGINVPIAVNISARNLQDRTLPDRLEQRLRAGGMAPGQLWLEVNKTAAFEDATLTMDVLSRLQLKGIHISIDNFGTGYASLKLLRQMPFSEIKMDRSFVGDMTQSRDARAIVKSVIDLAANMETGCVAQGVETSDIADAITRLGTCDLQGFWIARPMPVEAVPAWLAIWSRSEPFPAGSVSRTEKKPLPQEADVPAPAEEAGLDALKLSPRQTDVMRLLSDGRSVKEIARQLNLGVGTVKVHLSMAYSALGAHNRVEAIQRAKPALNRRLNGESLDRRLAC
jgi:EAL domain-containing protein (putative c-di-GMP-specific phosphodiesterase class I)/DNA-binding CsgD family transcriptional regulator